MTEGERLIRNDPAMHEIAKLIGGTPAMTDPFDWAGLIWGIRSLPNTTHAAAYLCERIEAAFVPVEHHVSVITDHDELLQHEIARAEAAEARVKALEDALRKAADNLYACHKLYLTPFADVAGNEAMQVLGGEHDK